MLVYDYSAYSHALHAAVTAAKPPWPQYVEVNDAVNAATLGDFAAYCKLCLWYHKLPLPLEEKANERLITDYVVANYKKLRPMYQRSGKYSKSHLTDESSKLRNY